MTNWFISVVALLALVSSSPSECMSGGTATGEAKEAVAVFAGEAIAREFVPQQNGTGEIVVFKFKVERVWKGKVPEEVLLYTQLVRYSNELFSLPGEALLPKEGERYLVFAYRGEGGQFTTRSCSRSRSFKNAEKDILELGIGYEPEKKVVGDSKTKPNSKM